MVTTQEAHRIDATKEERARVTYILKRLVTILNPDFQFDSDVSTFQRPSASLFIGVQAQSGRQEGEHPMGEKEDNPFQLTFNGFLKVDFQGSRVTSDGGLILIRELDERLGLGRLIEEHLSDSRQGANKKFPFVDLLRQSVYSRLAGYEDLNDAVRVSADPTFRLIGSKKHWDRGGALTSRLQSFEAELLATEENRLGLMGVSRELVAQAQAQDESEGVVLDMDSTESQVHGQQEGSAYNGHFASVCYHPLLLLNQHGDCLAAKLRAGNVSSAEEWDELLLPEIERQQGAGKRVTFRADAAFAKPEIYEELEERGVDYVIRIPANKNLELEIQDMLFRPPARPSLRPRVRYRSFRYQAASWSKPRRVVAKVEHHLGELCTAPGSLDTRLRYAAWRSSCSSRASIGV